VQTFPVGAKIRLKNWPQVTRASSQKALPLKGDPMYVGSNLFKGNYLPQHAQTASRKQLILTRTSQRLVSQKYASRGQFFKRRLGENFAPTVSA
jgi:hypothetical protein